MKITNLAVCFYGQWRSGEVCIPFLKSIIDRLPVDKVDVFCSIKDSLSFHASERLREQGATFIDDHSRHDITQFLNEHLNPVSINFISDPPDIIMVECNPARTEWNYHGTLTPTSFIDSLLQKQQHEARTEIFYDAVIMLRYDVLYRPIDYIPKLIEEIMASDDLAVWPNDPDSIISPASNHAFRGNDHGRYTMFPDMINDLFILFTGAAADRICYEMIDWMHEVTSLYGNTRFPRYRPYRDYMNFHVMFGRLAGAISLQMIKAPGISERWNTGGTMDQIECRLNNSEDHEIHMIVARPSPEINDLDPHKIEDYLKIASLWWNG
jgi:hypothetical protein